MKRKRVKGSSSADDSSPEMFTVENIISHWCRISYKINSIGFRVIL